MKARLSHPELITEYRIAQARARKLGLQLTTTTVAGETVFVIAGKPFIHLQLVAAFLDGYQAR